MFCISYKIFKNYAWEMTFLHWIRNFSDGIAYLQININSDFYEGDHNPQFYIELIFLNLSIFEFRIYNLNHSSKRKKTIFPID